MKDVSLLEVRQVRIFPADRLAFAHLAAASATLALAKLLGGAVSSVSVPGELTFVAGSFVDDDGKTTRVIKTIQISDRRIVLVVEGDSAAANKAYELVRAFVAEIGTDPGKPLTLTEETTCVATLDFDWTALIAPAVRDFGLGVMLEKLSSAGSSPEIRGLSFSFRLSYPDVPEELHRHGVTLAEKAFTIEPRIQTPLSERRYFTSSPTDTSSHFKLIEALEQALVTKS